VFATMFVVAQSDEPVRFLAGSPDPRSHKKIIPTRITKNPPTATRGRWCCPRRWSGWSTQKSQPRTITPTICTIVANRNPIIGVVGRGLMDQAKLAHPRAVGSDVGASGGMWGAAGSSQ
jgi:hypothetical protein